MWCPASAVSKDARWARGSSAYGWTVPAARRLAKSSVDVMPRVIGSQDPWLERCPSRVGTRPAPSFRAPQRPLGSEERDMVRRVDGLGRAPTFLGDNPVGLRETHLRPRVNVNARRFAAKTPIHRPHGGDGR